jgi:uncharacterized protein GlcG (DUF336 family)
LEIAMKIGLCTLQTLALAAAGAVGAPWAQAQQGSFTTRTLTPETALKAARATLEECRKRGHQVAVVVVERSGLPQVMLRDRFAGPHTPAMAQNKAWTAASFKTATSAIATETQPGRPMSGIRDLPNVIAAGGGVPIEEGGTIFGAIGVSGGPNGDADEACVKAGLKAIADDLAF